MGFVRPGVQEVQRIKVSFATEGLLRESEVFKYTELSAANRLCSAHPFPSSRWGLVNGFGSCGADAEAQP